MRPWPARKRSQAVPDPRHLARGQPGVRGSGIALEPNTDHAESPVHSFALSRARSTTNDWTGREARPVVLVVRLRMHVVHQPLCLRYPVTGGVSTPITPILGLLQLFLAIGVNTRIPAFFG